MEGGGEGNRVCVKKMIHVSPILTSKDVLLPFRWIRAKVSSDSVMGWTSVLFDQPVDISKLTEDMSMNRLAAFKWETIQKGKHYLFPLNNRNVPTINSTFEQRGSNTVVNQSTMEQVSVFIWEATVSVFPSFEIREAKKDNYASRVVEIGYPESSLLFTFFMPQTPSIPL